MTTEPLNNGGVPAHLSPQETMLVTDQLVCSATNCIVHADLRYATKAAQLGHLITDQMRSCVALMRAIRRRQPKRSSWARI